MAKAKVLMKGNHAIAESAIRAGCDFFAGYPITPQSELLEYMSSHLEKAGGGFIQSESEIAGISMVYGAGSCGFRAMTASSGPGFDLMQEGISYLAGGQIPAVIVAVMRVFPGLGNTTTSQGDYLQIAKNGGHGDYRVISLAPGNVQEAVDYTAKAFDLAFKYRNPVIVAIDGNIGQMVEAIDLPDERFQHKPEDYADWAILYNRTGEPGTHKVIGQGAVQPQVFDNMLRAKTEAMKSEAMWEDFYTDDADVIVVAYGTTARLCKEAALLAREEGVKAGVIRLKTLWPFPVEAFKDKSPKAFLAIEQCTLPQMVEDVVMTVRGKTPVASMTMGYTYVTMDEIVKKIKDVAAGDFEEV